MKAAVLLRHNAPFEVRDYPLLPLPPGMASVSLVTSGLCGTDVHIWEGAIAFQGPMILGHELIGRVTGFGDGSRMDCTGQPLREGDVAAVNVIEPCGKCVLCREDGAASCLHLGESLTYTHSPEAPPHLYGGFAEANVSPARYLHRLPQGLPPDVAAAFLCAGPTVICGMRYAGGVRPGDQVVVQGAGPVGLFAAFFARRCGAASVTVIASGSNQKRLELARAFSDGSVLDIRAVSVEDRRQHVLDATGGIGADLIIEATGNPSAIPEGLGLLRPRGRYVWAGQYSDRGAVPIPTHVITFNALQLFGTAQFTVRDRQDYFQFLLEHPEDWDHARDTVTHRFRIDQVNDAFASARSGEAVKILFVPDGK